MSNWKCINVEETGINFGGWNTIDLMYDSKWPRRYMLVLQEIDPVINYHIIKFGHQTPLKILRYIAAIHL
jgi:hypothetical protein